MTTDDLVLTTSCESENRLAVGRGMVGTSGIVAAEVVTARALEELVRKRLACRYQLDYGSTDWTDPPANCRRERKESKPWVNSCTWCRTRHRTIGAGAFMSPYLTAYSWLTVPSLFGVRGYSLHVFYQEISWLLLRSNSYFVTMQLSGRSLCILSGSTPGGVGSSRSNCFGWWPALRIP